MSGIEVGTAFVRVIPMPGVFEAALLTEVKAAITAAQATVKPIVVPVVTTGTGGIAAANAAASGSAATASASTTRALTNTKKGLVGVGTEANIARGALIGLSRITPVAVFGLGVMGTAAIAAGLAIKSAVTSAAEFQSQLNTFQAVTKATDEDMKQVSATALALGADLSLPATSANDAAVALTELSKAGLSVEDSLAAAKGVLQLATIAGISAGDAAVIAATQLNAFALAGDQAARVTELLADASIAAQGEITDFAAGFAQAGTAAKQSGVSIEDTTALLTQLGLAGIKGADGGTSLRTFLLRLVPTTKEAAQYTKALGIELDKNRSIGAQLPDVIEQYRRQLLLLNPQQQTLVLNQIFGQDAFRAASVIFSQEKDALRALTEEFRRTNSTQDLSKAKAEGLSGAVGSLKSQMETLGTQVGLVASGPLEAFVRGMSHTFDSIGKVAGAFADLEKQHDIVKKVTVIFDTPNIPSFLVPGSGKGESVGDFIKGGGLIGTLNKLVDKYFPEKKEILGPPLPEGYGEKPISRRNFRTPTEAEIAFNSVEGRRARARIAKQQADAAAKDQALKGIPIPKGLQQAQVDAQINNSLSAELSADNAILKYLERKRDRLVTGTKAYLAASKQVEAAQSQRDSVQAEIDGNSERQKADRDAARKKRVSDAQEEARKDQAAQEQLRRTIVNIQSQRFSNALAAANLTETDADNKKVLSAEQKRLEAARAAAQKIAQTAGLTKQQLAEAKLKVLELDGQILGIKSQIKNLGQGGSAGGGFSLNDLFKEALNQFQEFGSNVSTSITTPGGVRGALGGAIAAQNPKLTRADKDKIAVASESNDLLRQILATLKGTEPTSAAEMANNPYSFPGIPGYATSVHARKLKGHS